jgi:paraquat-inducible protein B
VYEIVITDIGVAFLPEDYIPYLEICRAAAKVTPELKKQMFYVRSAKLTTVFSRAFRKNEKAAYINGTVFCLGGEVYSSADQFKVDYIVSVDLVSLEHLLSLQNCNDLINNDELKLRAAEQAAALERTKAEEARKSRENELNALKSEIESLKKLLTSNSDNSKQLQKQLDDMQKSVAAANDALKKAEEKAKSLESAAQNARAKSQDGEKLVITVKNTDGKDNVLEITNLDELSKEKLKGLGFDIDALPKKN